MNLAQAIKKADLKAIRAAVSAGETVGYDELTAALKKDDAVLKLLLELEAIPLESGDDNVLHWIGYEVRSAWPNAARLKRAKDLSAPEPPVIVNLKHKAQLLIDAGAKLDFEGALRLGRTADVAAMLAKNPKLAKQRVAEEPPGTIAAYSGAWDITAMIKTIASGGALFDWAGAERAMVAWAEKAVARFAKSHRALTFRRLAFDFDEQGTLLLSADEASGKATRPGDYVQQQFADFTSTAKGGALFDALGAAARDERARRENTERFLQLLVRVAKQLERSAAVKALTRSKDFVVLVFDHDDDEKAARARR